MDAMRSAGATVSTRYFNSDNLGSIAAITDETGAVVTNGHQSYDAWGNRRLANGGDGEPPLSQTPRGFTGQEELPDVGLVHLNGRIYDPLLARMTSADPMVPDPLNGQAWNRYSYVVNNPLAFTDPSGYCFLGLCGIGNAFNNLFKGIQHLLRDVPIVGTIVEVAAAAICLGAVVCAVTAAFLSTTAVSGLETGSFKLGLRAGLIAAATTVAFWEVGNLTNQIAGVDPSKAHIQPQFGTDAYAFNVTAHAAVGCASAVASGGKCGPAALAGGVTSAAGPVVNGHSFFFGLVANAALGGGAAVLGGGKFENGAITSAFGYLFNEAGSGPYYRHLQGVEAAKQMYIGMGYDVSDGEDEVRVPGFDTPRRYDFIATDKSSGLGIGVEVKTTLYSAIFFVPGQVEKDVVVANQFGVAIGSGQFVEAVNYVGYCFSCTTAFLSFQSATLYIRLLLAGVPVTIGPKLDKRF